MDIRGTQLLADFYNCESEILDNTEKLIDLIKQGIATSELTYMEYTVHKFDPIGITALFIISESHIGIHTYPEHAFVSIDIYTCTTNNENENFIRFIKQHLRPRRYNISKIERGTGI